MDEQRTEPFWYKNFMNVELEDRAIEEMVSSCMSRNGGQQVVNDALASFRKTMFDASCPFESKAKEVLIHVAKTKEIEDVQKSALIRFLIERNEQGYELDYSYIYAMHENVA